MQELPRRHEERIVLENAATTTNGCVAHDINHSISAEFERVVGADDRIFVATPHIIDPRLQTQSDRRCATDRQAPSPCGRQCDSGEILPRQLPLATCSNDCSMRFLIEPTVLKVGCSAASEVRIGHFVGQRSSQFLCQLIVGRWVTVLIWTNDMNRLVSTLEPSLMNGNNTRYSSSSLLKNAQT